MTTDERLQGLIGLSRAKLLTQALAQGRSDTHAVLFYGPSGSGKTELASILAQAWLCTNPTEFGGCGECASCVSGARGTHPDLLVIEPQPPSNLIRLSAISGSDEGVSIQQLFRTPPLKGRNKVAIVKSAERMNADAAHAFLKTLEEPPARSKLILTSGSPGAMPATVLSRCLACACELPSDEETARAFPEADEFVRSLGRGTPGRIAEITENRVAAEEIFRLAETVASLHPSGALRATERFREISEKRESPTGGARRAQAETLAELGVALERLGCYQALTPIAEAHRRIVGNGNATLVLDRLFTQLSCAVGPGNSS